MVCGMISIVDLGIEGDGYSSEPRGWLVVVVGVGLSVM